MPSITFVTAYYSIYQTPMYDNEWRYKQFEPLMNTDIPLLIFTDDQNYQDLLDYTHLHREHILVIMLPMSEWYTQQHCKYKQLPEKRSIEKDTLEFMLLMNEKPMFMERAIESNYWTTPFFAWIDFSISYVFNQTQQSFTLLHNMAHHYDFFEQEFLYVPGCWNEMVYIKEEFIANDVCWRFCGGFFVGSPNKLLAMANIVKQYWIPYQESLQTITWEVNYWGWLEYKDYWKPDFFLADHNDSIIRIPPLNYAICLNKDLNKMGYYFPQERGYEPSNTSICFHDGQYWLMTRYVNYWYNETGHCGINDSHGIIRSRNLCSLLDWYNLSPVSSHWMSEEHIELPKQPSYFCGLEDVRIFSYRGDLCFLATQIEYSSTGTNQMMMGIYNLKTNCIEKCQLLHAPISKMCQKNWIPVVRNDKETLEETLDIIYSWCPMRIGKIDEESRFSMHTCYTIQQPWFHKIRGSTCFVPQQDHLVGLVHFSLDTLPRRYYHVLIALDKTTLCPVKCSDAFCFQGHGIEFCLGFIVRNECYYCWISQNDRDPLMVSFSMDILPLRHDLSV